MKTLIALYTQHPYISTLVSYYFVSAFIGALPAPTSASSQFYRFFFSFANALGANVLRAFRTTLEKSPNWTDAVQKAADQGTLPVANPAPAPGAVKQ
jgi:hypothetical protein